MTEQIQTSLEHSLRFHLSVLGYALGAQAQLGQVLLKTLETSLGSRNSRASASGPDALEPREPIIPTNLPLLLRAHWMLGMLFAGWRPTAP